MDELPDRVEAVARGRARSRWKWAGLAVSALVVWTVALVVLRAPVRFEGKPLENYFPELVRPSNGGGYRAATNALFSLGEEALPVVVKFAQTGPPPHVQWFKKWRGKLPSGLDGRLNLWVDPNWYLNRQLGAIKAVGILGTNAVPVAGELVSIFGREDFPYRSQLAQELSRLGAGAKPFLKPYLESTNNSIQALAVAMAGDFRSESSGRMSYRVSIDDLGNVILIEIDSQGVWTSHAATIDGLLRSPSAEIRLAVARAIGLSGNRSAENSTRLIKLIDDPNAEVRRYAALALTVWWSKRVDHGTFALAPVARRPSENLAEKPPNELDAKSDRWLEILRAELGQGTDEQRLEAAEALIRVNQIDEEVIRFLAGFAEPLGAADRVALNANVLRKMASGTTREPAPGLQDFSSPPTTVNTVQGTVSQ